MKRPNIHRWLLALLFASAALTACVKEFYPEDDVLQENPADDEHPFGDGPTLSFVAALDALSENALLGANELTEIENYVDPEKFRILFFDAEEENGAFLFESKTRFIKKLPTTTGSGSEWRVSVPLFNYGNAVNNGWYWEKIRNYLRDHPFKIAVLANHPENEWSMRILGKTKYSISNSKVSWGDNEDDVIVPGAWYDNSAPHWTAEDTLFGRDPDAPQPGSGDEENKNTGEEWEPKRIFDLHHCQYDPIYYGKGFDVAAKFVSDDKKDTEEGLMLKTTNNGNQGKYEHDYNKVYDFVTTQDENGFFNQLSPTSSWVSWVGYDGELGTNTDIYASFPTDGWIMKDWTDLIDTIYGPKNEGYQGTFSETNQGLTITKTTTDGKIKAPNKDCIDNNDGMADSGDQRVCFSFRLPKLTNGGEWQISVKVAAGSASSSNTTNPNYRELFLKVGGAVYDRKTFPSTTASATEYTFKTVSPEEDNTLVEVYAMGRTYFYSVKCVSTVSELPDEEYLKANNNKDSYGWKLRRSVHPSREYPIPMYGIQKFDAIGDAWDWGTNFTLNRDSDDPVFLLRSVVRIDLYLPSSDINSEMQVKFISFHYSNIFSRCLPMDIWTPTLELWNQYCAQDELEMQNIRKYGPIARTTDTQSDAVAAYRQRMSWIYGIWKEKAQWNFNDYVSDPGKDALVDDVKAAYPHIFNPCVQRNGVIICETNPLVTDCVKVQSDKQGFDQYVIYTGERNINDPSVFTKLNDTNSGKSPIAYFMIGFTNKKKSYTLPLVKYGEYNGNKTLHATSEDYGFTKAPANNDGINAFEQEVMNPGTAVNNRPYPLMRNHRYIFTISGFTSATRGGEEELSVTSEVRHSKFVRPEVAPKLEK